MKKRILLVDDDRQLNNINQKILQSTGIASEVHVAVNGNEGLQYLLSRLERNYPLPDIIVLDLEMPVMDGFEFLAEFRRLNFFSKHRIEVVVFTSSSNPKDIHRVTELGIRHYINKPYLLRGLLDVIHKMDVERKNADLKKGLITDCGVSPAKNW